MGIQVVEIPSQTAEDVFPRLEQHVELPAALLMHPVDVALHVPLRIARADNGDLGLQELRESFLPFVRTGRVTKARVEQNNAVQVRVEGLEILRVVHGVEVVDISGDLQLSTETVFHDASEWILGRSLR